MIKITQDQPLYKVIKRQVLEQTAVGYKRFAKTHYGELEFVWDDFAKRMRLIYDGCYFIPQQLQHKKELERNEDAEFKKFLESEK